MLPFSDHFIFVLQLTGLFALSALLFLGARKKPIIAIIPFVVFAILVARKFLDYGEDEYEALGDLLFLSLQLIVILASMCWVIAIVAIFKDYGQKTRYSVDTKRGILVLAVIAVLPALAVTTYKFEKQYVPDALCSNESITFILGAREYVVGPEFQPRIERMRTGTDRREVWIYSNSVEFKEDMKTLCDETENGHIPIQVDLLGMAPASNHKNFDSICDSEAGPTKEYCAGYSSESYQAVDSIRLTKFPEELISAYKSWFQHKDNPGVATGGNLVDGFVCLGKDDGTEPIHCTVWHPIDSEVTMFSRTTDVEGKSRAEVLQMAERAGKFTLLAFSGNVSDETIQSPSD